MPEFSIVRGAPIYRLMCKVRLSGTLARALLGAVALAAAAWLPLVALTLTQGLATGWRGALLEDFQVYDRCLIAIPLLLVADEVVDPRFSGAIRYLTAAHLVPDENRDAVERAIAKATRLRDSPWEVLLVVPAAYARVFFAFPEGGISWKLLSHVGGDGSISYAGYWYLFVTGPIFLVLLLRWVWRIVVWTLLLWRLSTSALQLQPTHPDSAGGLGPVADAHSSLGLVVLAAASVLAAAIANHVHRGMGSALDYKLAMILFVVVAPLLCVAPLLILAPVISREKRLFLMEYGVKAADYSIRFEQRWVKSPEPIALATPDIATDSNLGQSFQRACSMKAFLLTRRGAWQPLVLFALVPMVLVLMGEFPVFKILGQIRRLLS
jgi:hypothetical protein